MKIKSLIHYALLTSAGGLLFSCAPNADNAVEKLQEYGILDAEGDSSTGSSSDIMYHYKLFRDGNEQINDYPYILKLIKISHERNKKLPLPLVTEFVEAGANVNTLDENGKSALNVALSCYPFNTELINYLLTNGADPNIPGCESLAYFSSLPMFDIKIVNNLISHGANVNAKIGTDEEPLLSVVARTGNFEFVQELIRQGADVNAKNKRGVSVIMSTMEASDDMSPIVEFLLKSGAQINDKDSSGRTPIFIAIQMNSAPYIDMLIKAGADLFGTYYDGVTLLECCHTPKIQDMVTNAYWRQKVLQNSKSETKATDEVICSYINCGVFSNEKNNPKVMDSDTTKMRDDMFAHYVSYKEGKEALSDYPYLPVMMHLCQKYALEPRIEEVRSFIEAKADVNAKLPTGDKCIAGCYAVINKWNDIAKLLLDSGMNANGGDNDGVEHMLWNAAIHEDMEMCKLLISKGANIDAIVNINKNKYTLMALLLKNKKTSAAEILCKLGADPNATVVSGGKSMPAYAYAIIEKANTPCLSTMFEKGANPDAIIEELPMIALAIESGNTNTLATLIKHKCDVNVRYTDENITPLIHAAIKEREEMASMLIKAGANKELRAKNGETYESVVNKIRQRKVMNMFLNAASQSGDPSERAGAQFLKDLINN